MGGSLTGQPQGHINGTDYRDDADTFRAKITAVAAASGGTSGKAGFTERWQNPDTGAYEDKPDGRQGTTAANWIVLPTGATVAVNDEVLLRQHPRHQNRYEIVGSATSAGNLYATANADNDGSQWTPGATTGPGGGEVVDLQPRYGGGVAIGSFTFPPHRLWQNLEYACRDTGTRSAGTGRRRLLAWPVGLPYCDGGTLKAI